MALPINIEDLLNKRNIENNIIRRVGGDKTGHWEVLI